MNGLFIDICYLLFFIGPISIFIHESGHAAGAIIEKAYPITVHIGKGKRFFRLHIKRVNIIVYRWYFLGGATDFSRAVPCSIKKMILTSLAGPLCNLIVAAFFLMISLKTTDEQYLLWCLFNTWLGLSNIIPYKWRGNPSDGYLVWHAVRCRDNG
ncbi:site-2 protease family protein [Virgibacillus halophilus]|uniref:Peptidase M50 domain-containing protein n=1 Tax=Tigheibacillus halophilus TaxID=361280 RepID=A0ABU5CB97_9BACI|nr:hypothetical protein [Virgibacillus halophilus]